MKKVLALLLAVLMLASIGCAWAEGTTEEAVEITFQDIPWGSSVEEVKSWAKEKGFDSVTLYPDPVAPVFLDVSGKYSSGHVKSAKVLFAYAFDSDPFQIAGYSIYSLKFYFDVQDEKTELGTVVVCIQESGASKEQTQAILDDLEQKLITVYGENAVPPMDNSLAASPEESLLLELLLMANSDNDRYRKVDAENTAICLTNEALLVYGKTNVFVAEEENNVLPIDSFNIGGL